MKFIKKYNESYSPLPNHVLELVNEYFGNIEIKEAYKVDGTNELYIIHTQNLNMVYSEGGYLDKIDPSLNINSKNDFINLKGKLEELFDVFLDFDNLRIAVDGKNFHYIEQYYTSTHVKEDFLYYILVDNQAHNKNKLYVYSDLKNVTDDKLLDVSNYILTSIKRVSDIGWGIKNYSIIHSIENESMEIKIIVSK